jgi:hypothetical protein
MDRNREKFAWHEAIVADPSVKCMAAKVLAGWLMHRFDGRRLCVEMAEATIAEDLGWSLSKVKRAIKALRGKWLDVSTGRWGANLYHPILGRIPAIKERLRLLRHARKEARSNPHQTGQKRPYVQVKNDPLKGSEMTSIPFGRSLGESHYTSPPIEDEREIVKDKQDALLEKLLKSIGEKYSKKQSQA